MPVKKFRSKKNKLSKKSLRKSRKSTRVKKSRHLRKLIRVSNHKRSKQLKRHMKGGDDGYIEIVPSYNEQLLVPPAYNTPFSIKMRDWVKFMKREGSGNTRMLEESLREQEENVGYVDTTNHSSKKKKETM